MARFRPLSLFRRLSSRDSQTHTTNDKTDSSPASSPGTTPSPKARVPAYSTPSPKAVRKSRSLPKLRKKFGSNSSEGGREVEIPEAVAEQRESILFLSGEEGGSLGTTTAATTPADGQTPEEEAKSLGSDTLVSRRCRALELIEDKVPSVETKELRLEEVESLRNNPPIVTLEKPTPDAEEALISVIRRESESASPRSPTKLRTSEETAIQILESPEQHYDTKKEQGIPSAVEDRPADVIAPTSTASGRSTHPALSHVRQASIVDSANVQAVAALLQSSVAHERTARPTAIALPNAAPSDFSTPVENITAMLTRKIWVKRPGASATLVQIKEDDLVDDVRDMILRKYANSLGKTFDSPDMTLSLVSRMEGRSPGGNQQRQERLLGPEEEMCRTIDNLYPGGQKVNEALLINVPQRRSPRPSPRLFQSQQQMAGYQAMEEYRPLENGTDYFPPMPAMVPQTIPHSTNSNDSRASVNHYHHHSMANPGMPVSGAEPNHHPRSISVINTGQVPPLPSPGATNRRLHQHRPKYQRQPTSSPTIVQHPNAGAVAVNPPQGMQQGGPQLVPNSALAQGQPQLAHRGSMRPRLDSSASERPVMTGMPGNAPVPPPLPTPPAPEAGPTNKNNSQPPTPSGGASIRPSRPKKPRRPVDAEHKPSRSRQRRPGANGDASNVPSTSPLAGMLDNTVPPINVLIVEDNSINLRILESLMKRLKVRWQTAMNGQIAVDKWKAGGFHLVLMDIQMPIMNGLQATKEIRRLERVNNIGVFGSPTETESRTAAVNGDDTTEGKTEKKPEEDKLATTDPALFKSPIIIVALTASSLQSDRHEALAAGCNDFLTKPVNFVWLERKVKEWGCMQALIDFDGWRKWKDYATQQEAGKSEEEKQKDREKEEKDRIRAEKMAKLQEKQAKRKEEEDRKKKRQSFGVASSESTAAPGSSGGGSDVNGAATSSPTSATTLRPGTEVLGATGMNE